MRWSGVAAGVALAVVPTACGDDAPAASSDEGIADVVEWCGAAHELDVLLEDTDASDDSFSDEQASYEDVRQQIAELSAAIDVVDAEARDDVQAALDFLSALSTAFIEAEDSAAAEDALETLFAEASGTSSEARDWILETCGFDIEA